MSKFFLVAVREDIVFSVILLPQIHIMGYLAIDVVKIMVLFSWFFFLLQILLCLFAYMYSFASYFYVPLCPLLHVFLMSL